jgi:hypothetical protein
MAVIQLNPPGMVSTDEGYISSISIRNAGGTSILTPDGNNQITMLPPAATRLVGGQGQGGNGNPGQQIRLVTG